MANRLSLTAIVLAAALAMSGEAGAQTVVDAKGRTVGTLYTPTSPPNGEYVFRRISNQSVIHFRIAKTGIIKDFPFWAYLYTTTDCSGAAYLDASGNTLSDLAGFQPANPADYESTKGKLIYPGWPEVELIIASSLSPNSDPSICQTQEPEAEIVRPAQQLDVTSWRLVTPFRIK